MDLRAQLERAIAGCGAKAVAIGYCEIESGYEFFILPDEPFHAASTMKVCVLMELFHQAELGELSLDGPIVIHNEFRSIVDGSPFTVGIEDDSEKSLHSRIGDTEALLELAKPMITHSSNLATNLLVERLGAERITAFMADLGAPGLIVRRGVEDGKAYRLGLNSMATARGLTTIMVRLANAEVVSPAASQAMMAILLAQTHRSSIPAGLPEGVKVANKTGWNTGICHDCGIIFPENGPAYALAVLTRGLPDKSSGQQLIAAVSGVVFSGATRSH